jgi:hypothetical protein
MELNRMEFEWGLEVMKSAYHTPHIDFALINANNRENKIPFRKSKTAKLKN